MGAFTDFPNGLRDATDYLRADNSLNAQLSGSVTDINRLVVSAEIDFNLKEMICSLLAGRGLLLPNLQICISLNLKELIGGYVGLIQDTLYQGLLALDAAFDKLLDHLKLDEVLGRINNVLAEVTNIANMINFCSSPLDPISIPNILETAMESFLGAGKAIIDAIGQIFPDEIGGCLIDGQFNCEAFSGGILSKICGQFNDVITGVVDQAFIDSILIDINQVVTQIDDLMARETGVTGTYSTGGSDLFEGARHVNDSMGALYNADDEGIQGATRNAGALWGAYQQLGSYQVVDTDGNIYNNIFELFVDEDMLRLLRSTPNPIPEISEQIPVYNYCGEIIGYTKAILQETLDASVGEVPDPIDQPGFNAGGLPTNPVTAGEAIAATYDGGTVNNNITNLTEIDGSVLFVDSEAELLTSGAVEGQMVYRNDTGVTYVHNGGTSGTISDYNVIGSSGGAGDLSAFLANVNVGTGNGFLVRSGDSEIYRTITGTSSQITVLNGSGASTNPKISITSNPIIPGVDSMVLPVGTTGERSSTTNGAIRYNTTLNIFEGYQGDGWAPLRGGGTEFEGTAITTTATLTEVLFNGVRQTPSSNLVWFFTVTAVANRTTVSDATAIKIEGLVDNNAGSVTIVGAAGNKTVYNSTAGTSNYDLTLDIISNEFRVQVNGDTSHNVDWKVKLELIVAP